MSAGRKWFYGLTVVSVLAAGAMVMVQHHILRNELLAVADEKVSGFLAEYREAGASDLEIAASVVASRQWLVAGPATGKVSIYIRHPAEAGASPHIEGYDFFFAKGAAGWTQMESGRCTSESCTREGIRLLQQLDRH